MKYNVGDAVTLVDQPENKDFSVGVVTETKGKRWIRIAWSCGLIYEEHIDDIRKLES